MRVIVNNRDRVTSTRAMIEYLSAVSGAEIIIVDNASTYPPLLEWYSVCPVEVIKLRENRGPRAPWLAGIPGESPYAVTDSDLDLTGVPSDLLLHLLEGLDRFPKVVKAGLSLEVLDLPESPLGCQVRSWEIPYRKTPAGEGWWTAGVDTTFAVYRGGKNWPGITPAVRADRPYTARHLPWYETTEEDRYYLDHCNRTWASWSNNIARGEESCTKYSPPT